MPSLPALPQDANGLLKLAAQSMFDLYAQTVQGMMVVDREHRVVWISEGYKRFLRWSKTHLQRYATEFDFRWNYRVKLGYSDVQRTAVLLKSIEGKRLTYRRIDTQA